MKRSVFQRLVCAAVLSAPLAALANVTPLLNTGTSTVSAFNWAYNLSLAEDQDMRSGALPSGLSGSSLNLSHGSFLTVFNFTSYADGGCAGSTGWVCLVQNVGVTPPDGPTEVQLGPVNFTSQSASTPVINGQPNGISLGLVNAMSAPSIASTAAAPVRVPNASVITAISEPGSLALVGVALMLLSGGMRRLRRITG